MKKFFLFDFDGTIADTGPGVMESARYALGFYGFPNEPTERLRRFVGPPLMDSFQMFYGLSREQARDAVKKYRVRYNESGLFHHTLYPGMETLLRALSERAAVCVATSKLQALAEQILAMNRIEQYFTVVQGADADGSMTGKEELIREVLRRLGDPPKAEAVMIGDRDRDILGARNTGLESIGADFGYAEPGELAAAGADWIVHDAAELQALCLKMCES